MNRRLLALAAAAVLTGCAAGPGVHARQADLMPAAEVPAETAGTTGDTVAPAAVDTGDGVGDELFPDLGNPGLDVQHYDVALSYDPAAGTIAGSVGLDVVLTEDRDELTLDSLGPIIEQVTVDGAEAESDTDGPELRIELPQPGHEGDELRLEVEYRVDPQDHPSAVGLENGWTNTGGGSYVLNEPDGARTWLPCNDHPSDKATFTFTLSVPAGITAVANGALTSQRTEGDRDVWVWDETLPMATYLIQLLTGDYEIVEGETPDGLPLTSAVPTGERATMQPFLDVTPEMIAFFERWFGEYPLDRYGLAMADSPVGLAMETQGRSLFSEDDFRGGQLDYSTEGLLSHELAHQWFGDAVSPARWKDIWLNESFATYGQWMWAAHGADVDGEAEFALASRSPGSSADPSVGEMFSGNSYDGGAVVLHALRRTIGDDAFFELLQRWVADNNGESRATQDFVTLAEEVSGRDLADFFDTWLFADQPPSEYPQPAG